MNAAPEATEQLSCSCGRTFVHELSLKRHRWVTGHTEAEAVVAPVVEEAPVQLSFEAARSEHAYLEAMNVLCAKRLQQEQYEASLQAAEGAVSTVEEFVEWAGGSAYQGLCQTAAVARSAATSGALVLHSMLKLMLMLMIVGSLVSAGVGVGQMVASSTGTGLSQPTVWTVSQS
jgi:hypothetical protein